MYACVYIYVYVYNIYIYIYIYIYMRADLNSLTRKSTKLYITKMDPRYLATAKCSAEAFYKGCGSLALPFFSKQLPQKLRGRLAEAPRMGPRKLRTQFATDLKTAAAEATDPLAKQKVLGTRAA